MDLLYRRLRQLRLRHGLSSETVSQLLYVSPQAYSHYENGKRQISHPALLTLADYYRVSTDYLFGRTDLPHPISILEAIDGSFLKRYQLLDQTMQILLAEITEQLLAYGYSQAKEHSMY